MADHPDDIDRWLDEARIAEAAEARSRRHWLRGQLDAEATQRGVLLDLAEGGTPVSITTTAGRTHGGCITSVGLDHLVVGRPDRTVVVPLTAVDVLRTPGRGPAGAGHPAANDQARRLVDVVGDLAAMRTVVEAHTATASVEGRLLRVGQDMLTIETVEPPPLTAYVSLRSLVELSVFGSG